MVDLTQEEKIAAKEFRDKKKKYSPDNIFTKKLEEQYPLDRILDRFRSPDLLNLIHEELSKDHLFDDYEKMTLFIGTITSYLALPNLRKSIALKGDSSSGKDNAIKTILKHIPKEDWIFLTAATKSTMEDDIGQYKIIAYSEINVNRENGANSDLTETIKQMAEGGTSAIKKDVATGYKIAKHVKQDQKTILYGTTENETDEELHNRFIELTIRSNPQKIKVVNENTLNFFNNPNLQIVGEEDSWLAQGLRHLDKFLKVIIPYSESLKFMQGKVIFNINNPRSQRDVKRLMAFTCAIAWLHQLQRNVVICQDQKFIIAEPQDFLNAVEIAGGFFNQSYIGFDSRVQEVLNCIENNLDTEGLFARSKIQKDLGISRNTIRSRFKILQDKGLIEFSSRDGNQVYYKRGQVRCQEGLIGVKFEDLFDHLSNFNMQDYLKNNPQLIAVDPIKDTTKLSKNQIFSINDGFKEEGVKELSKHLESSGLFQNTVSTEKIDPLELTPSKIKVEDVKDESQ